MHKIKTCPKLHLYHNLLAGVVSKRFKHWKYLATCWLAAMPLLAACLPLEASEPECSQIDHFLISSLSWKWGLRWLRHDVDLGNHFTWPGIGYCLCWKLSSRIKLTVLSKSLKNSTLTLTTFLPSFLPSFSQSLKYIQYNTSFHLQIEQPNRSRGTGHT